MTYVKCYLEETNIELSLQKKLKIKYVTGGIIMTTPLAVTGIGLAADLTSRVKVIESELGKVKQLQLTMNDVTATVEEIAEAIEKMHESHLDLYTAMNIYMLQDQILIKLTEVENELTTFIQDLVLANSGWVTSTILSIPQLIKVANDATSTGISTNSSALMN